MTIKVVVIGGGVSGIMYSLAAALKGYEVDLIDAGPKLGGLWSSEKHVLDGRAYELDNGLRLPLKSGVEKWDSEIFHNSCIDFDWIEFRNWTKEASLSSGKFTRESSCLDARDLKTDLYTAGITAMVKALQKNCAIQPEDFANDKALLEATYGAIFAEKLFFPRIQAILGCHPEKLAPGVTWSVIPRRIILTSSKEVPALIDRYPLLEEYIAHDEWRELAQSPKTFLIPAKGGINAWVDGIKRYLIKLGVNIHTGVNTSSISFDSTRNLTQIETTSGNNFRAERLVWTAPPTLIARNIEGPQLSPISRPKFLSLGVHHLLLDGKFKNFNAQYCLNFELKPAFFRAVWWPNIVASQDPIISFETLLDTHQKKKDISDIAHNAFRQFMEITGIQDNRNIVDSSSVIHPNFLPIITPEYKNGNKLVMCEAKKAVPNLSFGGRGVGKAIFLNQIILEAFNAVEGW